MINVLIVCIIIQCLSHSADPAVVSEFTNPSTKKALAEHLGASSAARMGPSFTSVSKVREFTRDKGLLVFMSSKPKYLILLRNGTNSNHILCSRGERFPKQEVIANIFFEDHPVSVTLGKLQEGLANNFVFLNISVHA